MWFWFSATDDEEQDQEPDEALPPDEAD